MLRVSTRAETCFQLDRTAQGGGASLCRFRIYNRYLIIEL